MFGEDSVNKLLQLVVGGVNVDTGSLNPFSLFLELI